MLETRAAGSGTGVEESRTGGGGETGPAGVRLTLGKDRGSDEAGGKRSEPAGDPEGRKVEVERLYGVRESQHGRPDIGFEGVDGEGRGVQQAARPRDDMGELRGSERRRGGGRTRLLIGSSGY